MEEQFKNEFSMLLDKEALDDAYRLVVNYKNRGIPQEEMRTILDKIRLEYRNKSTDEKIEHFLTDVLDAVTGWCASTSWIYSPDYKEPDWF